MQATVPYGAVPGQQIVGVWQEAGLQVLGQAQRVRVQAGRAQAHQRPAREGRQQPRRAAQVQHAWQVLRRRRLATHYLFCGQNVSYKL